jgi:hypothetical protein
VICIAHGRAHPTGRHHLKASVACRILAFPPAARRAIATSDFYICPQQRVSDAHLPDRITGRSCCIELGSRMFCRAHEHTTIRCLEYLPAFAAPIFLDLTRLEFPAAQFNENVGEECRSHQPYINRQTLGALHASRLSDVNRLLAEAWTPRQLCAPQWRRCPPFGASSRPVDAQIWAGFR